MYYSALIGKPTEHSVSDIMFERLAKAAGIAERYMHLKVDVEENSLGKALNAFKTLGFKGLNVTLPYKIHVMDYLDEVDAVAKTLGAVNTVKLTDQLIGYNTDWLGIVASLKERLNGATIKQATIFGSGGAARAAIYACNYVGVRQTTVLYRNESSQKTIDLKNRQGALGIVLYDYSRIAASLESSRLIINATPAGMVDEALFPFDLDLISQVSQRDKLYFEMAFNPFETPLVAFFKSRDAQIIDGLWMMLYQGIAALSIWLGQEIRIDKTSLMKIHTILRKNCKS